MTDVTRDTTKFLRIGVLGCGQIAQAAHFEAVRKSRNAILYAMCDVAEDLLAEMAAIHHPETTYRDYAEMLADPMVDAVIVAVADQFHVPAALQAIMAGKHVLVEKPLGVTVEECELLAERVRESGLVLQVGSMKRFDPGIAFAHRYIKEEMGEMLALKAWYCDSIYRYAMTDAVQPVIVTSAASKRPAGNPKPTAGDTPCSVMAAIWSTLPAFSAGRSSPCRRGWSKSSGRIRGSSIASLRVGPTVIWT